MSIVLLLQMVGGGEGGWIGGGWLIYNRVWEGGTGDGYYLVVFVFFLLVLLVFVFSCPLSPCFK